MVEAVKIKKVSEIGISGTNGQSENSDS